MGNLRTLNQLSAAVGEWSRKNFGDQKSKTVGVPLIVQLDPADATGQETVEGYVTPMVLGHLAPLLGIWEETGELIIAKEDEDHDGILDSIADILIYVCDFNSRERIAADLDKLLEDDPSLDDLTNHTLDICIFTAGSFLARHLLKRHQGIRGYESEPYYLGQRNSAISGLLRGLDRLLVCIEHEETLCELGVRVFTETVSQRNWKENPQGGG